MKLSKHTYRKTARSRVVRRLMESNCWETPDAKAFRDEMARTAEDKLYALNGDFDVRVIVEPSVSDSFTNAEELAHDIMTIYNGPSCYAGAVAKAAEEIFSKGKFKDTHFECISVQEGRLSGGESQFIYRNLPAFNTLRKEFETAADTLGDYIQSALPAGYKVKNVRTKSAMQYTNSDLDILFNFDVAGNVPLSYSDESDDYDIVSDAFWAGLDMLSEVCPDIASEDGDGWIKDGVYHGEQLLNTKNVML